MLALALAWRCRHWRAQSLPPPCLHLLLFENPTAGAAEGRCQPSLSGLQGPQGTTGPHPTLPSDGTGMLLWLLCFLGLGAPLPHGKEAERQQSSACLCPQPDPGCSQTQEQADRFINSLQRSFGLFIYPAANSLCCINPHLEIIQRNPPVQPSPTGLCSSGSPAAPQAVWGHKFSGSQCTQRYFVHCLFHHF